MGLDWYLWDKSNNEAFDLGCKIWFNKLLDNPLALLDSDVLCEYICKDTPYIKNDEYTNYRKYYIPWFSEKLANFVNYRDLENLQVIFDQDEFYSKLKQDGIELKIVGSRYPVFYGEEVLYEDDDK